MTERRYPYAPIAPLLEHLTARQIGELIDTPTPTIQRWRARPISTIPEETADALATRLGVHPATVWDNWTDADTRPCAECNTRFVPRARNHQYCSTNCGLRARQRRYRKTPKGAEANRRRRRRYYAENGAYERAQERRRYEERRQAREEGRHPRRREDHVNAAGGTPEPAAAANGTTPPPSHAERIIDSTPDLEENAA